MHCRAVRARGGQPSCPPHAAPPHLTHRQVWYRVCDKVDYKKLVKKYKAKPSN